MSHRAWTSSAHRLPRAVPRVATAVTRVAGVAGGASATWARTARAEAGGTIRAFVGAPIDAARVAHFAGSSASAARQSAPAHAGGLARTVALSTVDAFERPHRRASIGSPGHQPSSSSAAASRSTARSQERTSPGSLIIQPSTLSHARRARRRSGASSESATWPSAVGMSAAHRSNSTAFARRRTEMRALIAAPASGSADRGQPTRPTTKAAASADPTPATSSDRAS